MKDNMKKGLIFTAFFLTSIFLPLNLNNSEAQEKCYTDWRETEREYSGGLHYGGSESEFTKYVNVDVNRYGVGYVVTYKRQERGCPIEGDVHIKPAPTQLPACFISGSPAICPPLDSLIRFYVNRERLEEAGEFTINWSSNPGINPEAECVLSGKDPKDGNFSEQTREGSRTYRFVQRGIYPFKFSCAGILDNSKSLERGTITKSVMVYAGDIPPPPKVSLKIEPASVKTGESAVLSWTSENASSLSINQGIGVVAPKGSIRISPSFTTRYTITGSGEFPELGLAVRSITLRVIVPSAPPIIQPVIEVPPEVEPVAPPAPAEKPQQIDLKVNGQDGPLIMAAPATFNLSWNLSKYCLAYGSWLGVKNKAGQEQLTETKPGVYTYKLYCPTYGSDEVRINVGGGAGTGAYVPLPIAEASISLDGKIFSRSARVIRGEPADIWLGAAYDVNGDKKVSRDEIGQWGPALSNGGRCDWNTDLNKGRPVFDGTFKNPITPQDCAVHLGKLTFYDKPGVYSYGVLRLVQNNGKISNTSYINIAVQEPPLPKGPPEIDFKINGLDGPVTLGAPAEYLVSWNVKNADTCTASGSWDGEKFPAGSQRFVSSEKKEFTYTLSCVGKLGRTTKNILLKITELPICDFSALPAVISSSAFERQSVLSWKCRFANKCLIAPGVDIKGETFGSIRVSPKITTNYILTCQNLEGNSSFDQEVEVR